MVSARAVRPGVDGLLAASRARFVRVTPEEAYDEVTRSGAVLVDTRNAGQRAADGTVPGALVVERNHLEWRFDPAGEARLPEATGYDVRVIVLCDEGYASSLAAASLLDLGLPRATDVVGGFQAWRAAGLPVVPTGSGTTASASEGGTGSAAHSG
ncbi:rhodanese-like domain-containing protein [Yinghuangia seranimata]|uniref:rhodanese-like domain-containing protein n=1 Tax=Yinghuangia seranimata TaxID=408067 RepID=UPI00248B2CC2|nr:rhodanese-like domain-containing protein [Yinghuangia seranimata]MDI2132606.1 rhodanese-like domain-containing protein [Yinghuangia seranimata]